MLHFWLSVLIKGVWDSLDSINQSKSGITFGVLVLVLTAMWLSIKHEWRTAFAKWWRTVGEGVAIAVVAWLVVLAVHLVYEPYHLLHDMQARRDNIQVSLDGVSNTLSQCGSDIRVQQTRSELLQNAVTSQQATINAQQGTVNSLQETLGKQQAAVTTCVGDLAKAVMPEPQTITVALSSVQPDPTRGKHFREIIVLTNKLISNINLTVACMNRVRAFSAEVMNGGGVQSGGAGPVLDGFSSRINIQMPAWTPTNPLAITAYYDEEDVGNCGVRQP